MAAQFSETLYHQLLDTIDSGVAVYEVHGDGRSGGDYLILEFNRFALEHEGKTKDEVVGKTLLDLRPNIDDFGLISVFREVWKTGEPRFFPAKVYVDDEFAHWYENRVFRLSADRIVAIYTDVTERKRAEIALTESEAVLREVLDNMQVAIAIYEAVDDGEDFVFVDMNEFAEGITHYKIDQVVGRRITELFPGEPSVGLLAQLANAWRTGETVTIPLKQYQDERITQWVENTIFRLPSGKVVAMFEDTYEQRMAEQALRESEERYRLAQRIGRVGNWEYDLRHETLWGSEEALRIFGLDEERGELTREQIQGCLVEEEPITQAILDLVDHGAPFDHEFEITPLGSSERRTVTSVAQLIRAGDGTPIKLGGSIQDITENAQQRVKILELERRALQSQKLETVGRLAGGIAHDFNNLLTVIQSCAAFLAEDLDKGNPNGEDVRQIREASERAAALTGQLLAFSRKQVLKPRILDLNEVVTDVERMLRRLLGEDIELRTSLHDDIGAVNVDPGQVEQVLMNLVVNARDAMPHGGTLTLATRDVTLDDPLEGDERAGGPASYVMLTVTDTGVGMDDAVRDRIFEPFFTTKENDQGTGLGLATAYGIVRQSGGDIHAVSKVGQGTTFEVYFPRVEAEKTRRAAVDDIADLRGTETVLVVEDEEPVRRLARRILESAGYQVLTARDGAEALTRCEEVGGDLDVVLTDVIMPGMSGRELADTLAARWPRLRVVFMSGYTDDAIAQHGVLEEGVHFLPKPFVPAGLLTKIRSVLDGD